MASSTREPIVGVGAFAPEKSRSQAESFLAHRRPKVCQNCLLLGILPTAHYVELGGSLNTAVHSAHTHTMLSSVVVSTLLFTVLIHTLC